ncbi:MAG: LysR family transcriptional regulator [Caulobacterales bacterium]|nr:LysR family transcriptional regulator [Caulobacterales bacterium]
MDLFGYGWIMARCPSLTSLRLFLQVASSLSFSETARAANLSQPALSRTIKLLEEDLGVRLFDRNSRNVRLTAAGATLLPIVERLTGDFDLAFRELSQTFEGQRGRVVIGVLPSAAANLLPKVIARFRRSHPQVEITVRENLSGGLYQSLQDRLIDFAVGTPPMIADEIAFEPLFEDDCILVCRPQDAEAIPDPAPWKVFRELPFIGMEPRSSVRMLTDAAFAKADIAAPALYECAQVATVGGLISAGLGISLLPRSTLPLLGSGGAIAWRTMRPPRVFRTIGVSRLMGRTLAPAATALLQELVSTEIHSDS